MTAERRAAAFLRWQGRWGRTVNLASAVSDGLWLGLLDDATLRVVDQRTYDGDLEYSQDDYNERGLFTWESRALASCFSDVHRIAVTGAGGGREVLALRRQGHDAVGFECHPRLAARAEQLLHKAGVGGRVHPCDPDVWPAPGKAFDGVVVGWASYHHMQGRQRRVAFLRGARASLRPGAPLLLSVYLRTHDSDYHRLMPRVANRLRRIRGDRPVEVGDMLLPNFAHLFTRAELEAELHDGGFDMVLFDDHEYGTAVGLAREDAAHPEEAP